MTSLEHGAVVAYHDLHVYRALPQLMIDVKLMRDPIELADFSHLRHTVSSFIRIGVKFQWRSDELNQFRFR